MFTIKVNAQTIQNTRVGGQNTNLRFCKGSNYSISFDTIGSLGPSAIFQVELSSSTGSFTSPTVIASSFSTITSNILIPLGSASSNSYKIRVVKVSPTPAIIGDTLVGITIDRPIPNFTFSPNNVCSGTPITFTNSSTSVAGIANYAWSFGATPGAPANNANVNPTVVFNPGVGNGTANYTPSLSVTDNNGCTATLAQTNAVQIKRLPDPSIIADPFIAGNFANFPNTSNPNLFRKCNLIQPYQLTITDISSTSATNTNHLITWGDTGINYNSAISPNQVSKSYGQIGVFNLLSTYTNNQGCTNVKSHQVYIGTNPLIGLPNNTSTTGECVTKTYSFQITNFSNNTPGTTYRIESNDRGIDTNFSHPPPSNYSKTYNFNSCGYSTPQPYPNSFFLRIVATNPCGSSTATFEPIQLSSKPTANFNITPNPACINSIVSIQNTTISGKYIDPALNTPSSTGSCDTSYFKNWNIVPAAGWTLVSGQLSGINASNNLQVRFQSPGIYTIRLIVINNLSPCGTDTITKTICVQPIPIPNFSLLQNPSNGCKNNTISITNTSNTLLSCSTPVYTWTIKDSTTSAVLTPGARFTYTSGTNANSANPVLLFSQKGRYAIRLTISNTCPGNYFKDTLIIIKDIPVVGLPPDIIYCDSQTINYGATYDSSFSAITQYNWSISQTPGPQTGFSFVSGSNTSRNPRIRFTNFTTAPISYRIILTATNECGISLPDTQNIIINPKPIVTATSSVDSFCSGGTTSITLSNNLVGGAYYWRAIPSSPNITGHSNNTTGSNGPITQTIYNIGSTIQTLIYRITARQTSTNCAGDSVDVLITIFPIPRVLAANKAICSGNSTNLLLNSTVATSLFTWTASSVKGLSTGFSNQITPVAGPISQTIVNSSNTTIDSIKYVIRAKANGCNSADTTIYVIVYPLPSISSGTQTICSGNLASFTPIPSVSGSTFTYTTTVLSGTLTGNSNGNGNISQTLTNTGVIPAVVRYTITPTGPAPNSCIGLPVNFTVTVNPIPVLTVTGSSTICSGTPTNIVLNSNVSNTLFTYDTLRIAGVSTFGYYPKTTDTLSPIAQVITNNGTINAIVRYTITPKFGICSGSSQIHNVTIIPGPTPGTLAPAATVCSGANGGTITLTGFSGTIIRWERSIAPFITFDSILNSTASLSYTNLTQTTKYRVVLNTGSAGACGEVKSAYVQISVDSTTIAGSLTGTDTVCISGNTGQLTLLGLRGTVQYWQRTTSIPGTWSIITASASVNPYSYINLTQSTWYRVQVKNGVCTALFSDSVRIKVDSLPSPAITRDTSYCLTSIGTPITATISANSITSGLGTWRFLSGPTTPLIANQNHATTSVSNLLNGVYFLEWTVANGKCPPHLDTLKLTIYQPMVANIGSNQTICSGQTPLFLSSAIPTGGTGTYTFKWQQSTNGTSYTDIPGATLMLYQPPSLTSTIWYRRITYSGTCEFVSNAVQIIVQPAIANNIIAPNSAVCIGVVSPIIYGSTPTGGNGFYRYQWQKFISGSWLNLGLADTLIDYAPGLLSATSYFRRVVSSGQCAGAYSLASNIDTCIIYPLPTVNAGLDYSKCSNQTKYFLGGTPSGGTWSGSYVSFDSINPSQMPLGSYTLVYSFTNSNGCLNRDTVVLSIIAPPVVYAGADFSICENSPSIQLIGFTPNTGGTWSGSGVNASGLFNPSVAGAGSFSLIYSFTAGSGCNGSDTLVVTVNPKPNTNFTIPTQKCALDTFALNATTNSMATITSYLWSVTNTGGYSNLILSNYTNQNVIGSFPENKTTTDVTYMLKLVSITNFGCSDSMSKPIVLRRRPNAQFSTGSAVNCGPANYSISNLTSNVTSTYLWSTTPSSSVTITSPSSVNPSILFPVNTTSTALNYEIKLTATRNDATLSCTDTTNNAILIYPKPFAGISLTPANSGCSPLSVTFTNTSDPKNSEPQSSMSFVWLFSNFPSDTNRNQTKTYTNTGVIDSVRNIQLIATSKWGCKDTAQTFTTVFPFPKSDFTAPFYSACAPFVLNASSIALQQYPNAVDTYTWQILNKQFAVLSTSIGTSIPSYSLTNPDDTIYYRLITTNVHGCKPDTLTRLFRTISNPRASFLVSDSIGCSPFAISYSNTSSTGVALNWSFGNGLTSTSSSGTINYTNNSYTIDSFYILKLVITAGGSGCKDSISKTILVYPKPLASFSIPSTYCSKTVLIPTNGSLFKAGTVNFGWKRLAPPLNSLLSFSDTTASLPGISLPDNQLNTDTSYTIRLRVTSVDGCIDDTTKAISVLRRPLVQFTVPPTFCGPTSVVISNTTSNVPSNWLWRISPDTSASILTATSQNPTFNFNQNNGSDSLNYSLKLIATRTGSNCVDSLSKSLTIYPKPQAQFSILTQDSCGPRWVKFTNTSNAKNSEPMSSMSYLWTSLGLNRTGTNDSGFYVNSAINDSSYTVRLISTSMHECKDTIAKNVLVYPNAKAVYTRSIGTACAPFFISPSNINVQSFANANSSYEWYKNGVFIGSGINFPGTSITNQADSAVIKLKAISKKGCKNDSMEMWFYTIENPKPGFIAIDSVTCSGTNIQFTNLSTPNAGLTYRWELGSASTTSNSKNTFYTFYNYSDLDTLVSVKLVTIAGGTGCMDSISKIIRIKPLPNPNFTLSDTILCFPKVLFTTNSSTQIPPINNTSYKWFVRPIGANILNDTSNTQTSISFTDNQSGTNSFYTITLRSESNFGCIDSIQKRIRIPTRPKTIFTFNVDSSCGPVIVTSSNQSLYSNTFQWSSVKNGPTIISPSSFSTNILFPGHTGLIDSIYPIKLISTNSDGCADTLLKPFRIFPNPVTRFATSLDSGCAPLPIGFFDQSIIRKPAVYQWSFGDGVNLNTGLDTVIHTYFGSIYRDTTYISRLISISANGCKDTLTKAINVLSGAVANIHLPDTQLCSSKTNPTSLRIENKSYGSVDTFYWNFGDGQALTTTADSNIFHPYNKEGYYQITLKAVNNCRESFDTAYVLVQTPPNLLVTKTDSVGCSPMSVTFTNASTDTFRASFNWSMGNGNSYTSFQVPVQTYLQSVRTDTFYYINHSISNFCGNFIKKDTVRVLPKPTSFFLTNTDSGCSPLPVFMLNQSFGVPQQFLWHFGNGDSSTRQTPIQNPIVYSTIDTPSTYTIRLIVTNICGTDTSYRKVKVMPNTVKSFFTANVQNGCDQLIVQFTDYATGGQNISWNFGDGSGSTTKNPRHTFSNPGTYRVFQYVNNNCSFDTSSLLINVYPSPRFTIEKITSSNCVKSPVFFKANIQDPGTLTWHFGDGDSSQLINPVHYYQTAGLKVFKAILVSNTNYCRRTITDSIFINALPQVKITADTIRACQNVEFRFVGSTLQPSFLIWDFGDSTYGLGYGATHFFSKPGNYQVKVIATNAVGCSDTAINDITVYPVPTASFGLNPADTCNGPAWVNFTNTSVGANTYRWTFGNGNTSNSVNERQFFSGIGKYNNQLIATNSFLCKDTSEAIFEIFEKPVPEFTFAPVSICAGQTVSFTNKSKLGVSYLWFFGDGDSSTLENPTHIYKDSGQYKVTLFVYAGTICFDSLSSNQFVIVHPNPNPSFLHIVNLNKKPNREVMFQYTGTNGYLLKWQFGDGNLGLGNNPFHTYGESDSGCFEVKLNVQSFYGCDTTLSDTICLPGYWKGLFVPNAFTPNYGIDEVQTFLPAGKELKNYHLKIYTKWGELVWESTELKDGKPAKGWDGKHKDTGNECDQGGYIWTIEATFTDGKDWDGMLFPGATKNVKFGNVTLIR